MIDHLCDDLVGPKMTELTRAFAAGASIEAVLTKVTTAAVNIITGVDAADVVTVEHGQFCSLAATSDSGPRLSAVQQDTGQGPDLDAIHCRMVVHCEDLRCAPPWPYFARTATAIGVHSVVSYRLETLGTAAVMNFYGCKPHAFGAESQALGAMLAAHATIALIAEERRHQFASALASRDVIGQAKGMIMERFDLNAGGAFDLLRRVSQDTNTPVADIAYKLTTSPTGRTRGGDRAQDHRWSQ
jgi:hypothetical protein